MLVYTYTSSVACKKLCTSVLHQTIQRKLLDTSTPIQCHLPAGFSHSYHVRAYSLLSAETTNLLDISAQNYPNTNTNADGSVCVCMCEFNCIASSLE